jgi:AcrR family transcriptional regulator
MPRPTVTPPAKWVEEGLRALAVGGPDAVRIETLAQTLGVTKGGFYNHFDGRGALLDEMLDAWERLVIDQVIARVEADGADAKAKLRALFAVGSAPARELMAIELAIRDWARRDRTVARRLKRIDNRRMEYMRSLFSEFCPDDHEVELRCLIALSLFIAIPSMAASEGRWRRSELRKDVWERLLES